MNPLLIPLISLYAPLMVMDLPMVGRLRVTGVEETPECLVIHLLRKRSLLMREARLRIVVDDPRGRPRIDVRHTDDGLVSSDYGRHHSSAEVGIVIVGLPGIILGLPLIALVHGALYPLVRALTGVDHYGALTMTKLRWRLAPEHRRPLFTAMRALEAQRAALRA